MSRVDTTSFAQILGQGLDRGIGLGQSADHARFQQQQFAANEQQRGFSNRMAMDDQVMRRQQIAQYAAERVAQRQKQEERETANRTTLQLIHSGNPYDPSDPALASVIGNADPSIQEKFFKVGGDNKRLRQNQEEFNALVNKGKTKFKPEEVDYWLKEKGVYVPPENRALGDDEQKKEQDRQSYLIDMKEKGWITPAQVVQMKDNSFEYIHDQYKKFAAAAEAQAKALAEQQAAVQKQQEKKGLVDTARQSVVAAGGDPMKFNALADGDAAGIPVAGLLSSGDNNLSSMVDSNIKKIDADAKYWRDMLESAGVLNKSGSLSNAGPLEDERDSVKAGKSNAAPLNDAFAKYKQALFKRQQLMNDPNRFAGESSQTQQPATQQDARSVASSLRSQGLSNQQIADELRRRGLAR